MSPHLHQTDKFMQVIEPKHFNIKSQGFIAVFITNPIQLKTICLKKQELTFHKLKKLLKADTLSKSEWQHLIKYICVKFYLF